MKCPECQFENPEGSLFCGDCGSPLEINCPKCGAILHPGFKFCNKCGQDLRMLSEEPSKDISFNEKLSRIQKYLPKGIAEKIISQKDRIGGKRKQVAIMFCDMKGFTPLAEKLGADETFSS